MFQALSACFFAEPSPQLDGVGAEVKTCAVQMAQEAGLLAALVSGCPGLDEGGQRRQIRAQAAMQALLIEHLQGDVASCLQNAQVPHLFLKGSVTDGAFFGGQGLRGSSDVDVLVAPEQRHRALNALSALHFAPLFTPKINARADDAHGMPLQGPEGRPLIDLHFRPWEPPFSASANAFLKRAVLQGTVARDSAQAFSMRMDPLDTVLFAAGNLGLQVAGRYKNAIDAAAALRAGLDWSELVLRAQRFGVQTPLWALLKLVQQRLGAAIPAWVLDDLRPHAFVARRVRATVGVDAAPIRHDVAWRRVLLGDWPMSGQLRWPLRYSKMLAQWGARDRWHR